MAKPRPDELAGRFGTLLKALRESAGYSQQSLARASGLSRTWVGEIERGARGVGLATVYRLAAALRLAPADLLPDPRRAGGGPP
jgi:transcriptional regulator with XRE-family HTH domain